MSTILENAERLRLEAISLLMAERQDIDNQLAKLGYAGEEIRPTEKKTRACKTCGQSGHNSKTCPQKPTPST